MGHVLERRDAVMKPGERKDVAHFAGEDGLKELLQPVSLSCQPYVQLV